MSQTIKKEKEPTALDNYDDFNNAVLEIHRTTSPGDEPCLEVSEKLFGALTRGQKTSYLTYGQPGIKVFKVGTQDQIEREEAMPAEANRDLQIKRAKEAMPNV